MKEKNTKTSVTDPTLDNGTGKEVEETCYKSLFCIEESIDGDTIEP